MTGSNQTNQYARLLPRWLKLRWQPLVFTLLAMLVFALVAALYKAPAEMSLYAAQVCLVLLMLWAVWDYLQMVSRHKALLRMLDDLPGSLVHLGTPEHLLESDYQLLLHHLADRYREALTREDNRYRALGEYILRFSHQVKTPIAAARLLLEHANSPLRLSLEEELFRIDRQVDMVLHSFKLERKQDDLLFASHQLKSLVSQAVRDHARFFVLKKLSLDISIPEDLQVVTDSKLLVFVLAQLISNGVKYTVAGGIHIYWEEDASTLVIRDTGPGIPAQDLPRVTEQGYTGQVGHQNRKATGMGLYLCRLACGRLHIGLALASPPGEGLTARLSFGQQLPPKD